MGDWRDRASCRRWSTDLWFSRSVWQRDLARRICAECPVRAACLADALTVEGRHGAGQAFGIRAGLDGPQRDRLRQMATRRPTEPADALRATGT